MWELRNNMDHPNIIKMVGYNQYIDLFTSEHILQIYMRFPINDLDNLAYFNYSQGYTVSSNIMLRILSSIINALCYLQSQEVCHGNLNPKMICMFDEDTWQLADNMYHNLPQLKL
jgi:serine/threonine protein kinase